jgi:hypothetical protein
MCALFGVPCEAKLVGDGTSDTGAAVGSGRKMRLALPILTITDWRKWNGSRRNLPSIVASKTDKHDTDLNVRINKRNLLVSAVT